MLVLSPVLPGARMASARKLAQIAKPKAQLPIYNQTSFIETIA
jgi:hypothetical protein